MILSIDDVIFKRHLKVPCATSDPWKEVGFALYSVNFIFERDLGVK